MAAVVITGASKGIGRAAALRLAKRGLDIIAGVRRPEDGEELKSRAPDRIRPIILDITNPEQIAAARALLAESPEGVAGLVNNAGTAFAAPLELLPIEDFRKQLEVNLVGHLAVIQALLPALRRGRGRIVNVSSVGGRIAGPVLGAYHASKYALEALGDSLRQELASQGIHVVTVEPGAIDTEIWATATQLSEGLVTSARAEILSNYTAAIAGARKFAAASAKRAISPERVAEVVERALTSRRPKTRYTVGIDAWVGAHLLARLPDRLRDRLL